jgi:lipid A 3-O-deacylase
MILLVFCIGVCDAQKIDNTAFYREHSSGKSLRIHYENDFFSKADIYYTQGINLELYHPRLENFFLYKVLPRFSNTKIQTGIAVEHLGFTPTSISSPAILEGDRPFAACLMAKIFSISTDSIRKFMVTATFSSGIIGPGAGGKQFQSAIHRWINDQQPKGWDNQIKNNIILNYNIGVVKNLVDLRWLMAAGKASADLGTLQTRLSGGVILMTGIFNNRWTATNEKRCQVYVYEEPLVSLIGYDATMQGGIFNNESRYTIPNADITRTVFQNNSGIIFVIRKLQLEYFQSFVSKEFSTGKSHHWGGVRIGVNF